MRLENCIFCFFLILGVFFCSACNEAVANPPAFTQVVNESSEPQIYGIGGAIGENIKVFVKSSEGLCDGEHCAHCASQKTKGVSKRITLSDLQAAKTKGINYRLNRFFHRSESEWVKTSTGTTQVFQKILDVSITTKNICLSVPDTWSNLKEASFRLQNSSSFSSDVITIRFLGGYLDQSYTIQIDWDAENGSSIQLKELFFHFDGALESNNNHLDADLPGAMLKVQTEREVSRLEANKVFIVFGIYLFGVCIVALISWRLFLFFAAQKLLEKLAVTGIVFELIAIISILKLMDELRWFLELTFIFRFALIALFVLAIRSTTKFSRLLDSRKKMGKFNTLIATVFRYKYNELTLVVVLGISSLILPNLAYIVGSILLARLSLHYFSMRNLPKKIWNDATNEV